MNNDLISREALRKNMEFICMGIMAGTEPYNAPLTEIDNAESVTSQALYNGIVELVSKNGLTSLDELLDILKKGVKNEINN